MSKRVAKQYYYTTNYQIMNNFFANITIYNAKIAISKYWLKTIRHINRYVLINSQNVVNAINYFNNNI